MIINPSVLAETFREEIRSSLREINFDVKLVGLLASDDESSYTYSQYMKVGCEKVGLAYDEIILHKDKISTKILELNENSDVTGVIVYYPIYGGNRDVLLRESLSPYKDVEGLHPFWLNKLYSNDRLFDFQGRKIKALLPCTPLAIVKLLDSVISREFKSDNSKYLFENKVVTIFNRSEVVGRPLAHMLANDGASVYSFDINDVRYFDLEKGEVPFNITRQKALSESDIVITGVPSDKFEKIKLKELNRKVCCLNFSSYDNFEDDVKDNVNLFIPRVGPVTVAMCLRNLVRMAQSFRP